MGVYRRSHNDWDDSCRTSYQQKTGCRFAVLDLDNTKGGDKGSETITLNSVPEQGNNVYMIFVDNLSEASLKSLRILMHTLVSLMDWLVTRLISKHQTTTMKNTGLLVASDSRMVLMNSCPSIPSSIQNPVKRSLICVLRTLATVLQPLRDHGINSGDKHFN